MFNELSMFACMPGAPRGRHERRKKRSKTAHKKHHKNNEQLVFFQGPRPSLQKSPPKTVKMSTPGGQNDPQERPRRGRERPKRSQDDPKSAPRAPQEPPRGSLGGHLGPTSLVASRRGLPSWPPVVASSWPPVVASRRGLPSWPPVAPCLGSIAVVILNLLLY